MNKPPNISTDSNQPVLRWDKSIKPLFTTPGPKYLMMVRTNSSNNLTNISPFLIKKAIDATCNSEIEECKKIRNENILIKTKNHIQANKLLTLTALSNTITIEITEHKTLNQTKGVVYCNDLRDITESEILDELKAQNVCQVAKILKKSDDNLIETGLIILTFASTTLPSEIKIGYQNITIRPYIPQPLRCYNCLQYGHSTKFCNNQKLFPTCANIYHLNDDTKEVCLKAKTCLNCTKSNITPNNHAATDKNCPVFVQQKELQAIKTTLKVDNKTALNIYRERHQHQLPSYSSVASIQTIKNNNNTSQNQTSTRQQTQSSNQLNNNPTTSSNNTSQNQTSTRQQTQSSNQLNNNPTTSSRAICSYNDKISDLDSDSDSQTPISSSRITSKLISDTKLKILPKNTPKRLLQQIKNKNKISNSSVNKTGKSTRDINENDNYMEHSSMDLI